MNSIKLLKFAIILVTPLLLFSCSSWQEVAAPNEFQPLKVISISSDSMYVGGNIIITGENFIDNKEYNQVWFGRNIRGIVDSATATKLFLKVPSGARNGIISVTNGLYSDTLPTLFKVVLRPPAFKKMSISYGGLQVEKQPVDGRGFVSGFLIRNATHSNLNFSRYNFIPWVQGAYCGPSHPDDYSDSTLHSLDSNTYSTSRKFVIMSVDTTRNILPHFSFTLRYFHAKQPRYTQDTGTLNCTNTKITLKNVPYSNINGKKSVKLNSVEFQKYLVGFFESVEDHWYSGPINRHYYYEVHGVYTFLPDAYFELTLE